MGKQVTSGKSTASTEVTVRDYTGTALTTETVYTDDTRTTKVLETVYTYSGNKLTQKDTTHFGSDGTTALSIETVTYHSDVAGVTRSEIEKRG